jgi:hypothetical protein
MGAAPDACRHAAAICRALFLHRPSGGKHSGGPAPPSTRSSQAGCCGAVLYLPPGAWSSLSDMCRALFTIQGTQFLGFPYMAAN